MEPLLEIPFGGDKQKPKKREKNKRKHDISLHDERLVQAIRLNCRTCSLFRLCNIYGGRFMCIRRRLIHFFLHFCLCRSLTEPVHCTHSIPLYPLIGDLPLDGEPQHVRTNTKKIFFESILKQRENESIRFHRWFCSGNERAACTLHTDTCMKLKCYAIIFRFAFIDLSCAHFLENASRTSECVRVCAQSHRF